MSQEIYKGVFLILTVWGSKKNKQNKERKKTNFKSTTDFKKHKKHKTKANKVHLQKNFDIKKSQNHNV